jgi:hypothetical protein
MTTLNQLECEQLRIVASGVESLSVDTENKIVKGFTVAQLGPFKSLGRGEFDDRSLRAIVRLIKSDPDGLPSYFGHAKPGENPHQLGKLLGRAKNPRIEEIPVTRNGERVMTKAVLADLHLNPTAFEGNPNGNIGGYVMGLASSDPRAFGSSLVLEAAKEHRLNRGRAVLDDNNNPLPPLWRPLSLSSIDVVGQGESVDSFLPSRLSVEQASEYLSADPEASDVIVVNAEIAEVAILPPSDDGLKLDLYLIGEQDG